MKFIDNVEEAKTAEVADILAAMKTVTLEGEWSVIRETLFVSAHEGKTGNIHFFASTVPAEMAQELLVREQEIFHPVGDVWS